MNARTAVVNPMCGLTKLEIVCKILYISMCLFMGKMSIVDICFSKGLWKRLRINEVDNRYCRHKTKERDVVNWTGVIVSFCSHLKRWDCVIGKHCQLPYKCSPLLMASHAKAELHIRVSSALLLLSLRLCYYWQMHFLTKILLNFKFCFSVSPESSLMIYVLAN